MKPSTDKVVLGAGLALLVWEAYTILNRSKDDTISEFVWRSMRRPLVPFAIGALAAHFVWQSQDVYDILAVEGAK